MRFLSLVGNSFGCSASGERLVSAARDGDLQEAKALLEYNPRLARYSTFGVRNSPLHYSAAQGHLEIVSLLLESGVDINLRNYRGQTALMQACQYGHWEVVQTLVLFKANIHKADYLNGGTALHLAALNGHSRCIRILLADHIPSIPNVWKILRKKSRKEDFISEFDEGSLQEVIDIPADGGITALHMASLNGHADSLQLLLDLGASVDVVTVEDGTTIDLIGAGSTPLHYAACGGNKQCCQILIAWGASLDAENANGCTPLMVSRSWNRDGLEEVLRTRAQERAPSVPSPYLCLPLMSIVKIARECGWRSSDSLPTCVDPCAVCLENSCSVAAEGCLHEFCTRCALYLCTTTTTTLTAAAHGPPGSIACPLCRHGIVSFTKLAGTIRSRSRAKEMPRTSLSLPFCSCSVEEEEDQEHEQERITTLETAPLCKPDLPFATPLGSSFRSLSCQRFSSWKLNYPSLCLGGSDTSPKNGSHFSRSSRSGFKRSMSERGRSWLCSFNQSVDSSLY